MGFREHVFDLLAGPDVPVRYSGFLHGLLKLRSQSLPFSHLLHNSKGKLAVHPFINQIGHNIITGTDGRRDRRFPLQNKSLGIIQPHIGSVRQSGNPDQV